MKVTDEDADDLESAMHGDSPLAISGNKRIEMAVRLVCLSRHHRVRLHLRVCSLGGCGKSKILRLCQPRDEQSRTLFRLMPSLSEIARFDTTPRCSLIASVGSSNTCLVVGARRSIRAGDPRLSGRAHHASGLRIRRRVQRGCR